MIAWIVSPTWESISGPSSELSLGVGTLGLTAGPQSSSHSPCPPQSRCLLVGGQSRDTKLQVGLAPRRPHGAQSDRVRGDALWGWGT